MKSSFPEYDWAESSWHWRANQGGTQLGKAQLKLFQGTLAFYRITTEFTLALQDIFPNEDVSIEFRFADIVEEDKNIGNVDIAIPGLNLAFVRETAKDPLIIVGTSRSSALCRSSSLWKFQRTTISRCEQANFVSKAWNNTN